MSPSPHSTPEFLQRLQGEPPEHFILGGRVQSVVSSSFHATPSSPRARGCGEVRGSLLLTSAV